MEGYASYDCNYGPSSQVCNDSSTISDRSMNVIRNTNNNYFGPGVNFDTSSPSPALSPSTANAYYANRDYDGALKEENKQYKGLSSDMKVSLEGVMLAFVATSSLAIFTAVYLMQGNR